MLGTIEKGILIDGMVALIKRDGTLPTDAETLAEELLKLAGDKIHTPKQEVVAWLQS